MKKAVLLITMMKVFLVFSQMNTMYEDPNEFSQTSSSFFNEINEIGTEENVFNNNEDTENIDNILGEYLPNENSVISTGDSPGAPGEESSVPINQNLFWLLIFAFALIFRFGNKFKLQKL